MKQIDIYSPKGGVGKTTLTVNIAACLVEHGYRVAVADMDEQRSTISIFKDKIPGVDFFTVIPKSGYDFVLVDHHPSHQRTPTGDVIVMPMKPYELDIVSTKRAAANVRGKDIIMVLTQVMQRREHEWLKWLDMRKFGALLVKNRANYGKASNQGLTVFQTPASGYGNRDARKEILAIVEQIKQRVFKQGAANE